MTTPSTHEREIREILIAANSGEATDEQLARLDELIRIEPQAANYAARILDQQVALSWQGATGSWRQALASRSPAPVASPQRRTDDDVSLRQAAHRSNSWIWPSIAVGIAFVLGSVAAPFGRDWFSTAGGPIAAVPAGEEHEGTYGAQLVRSTACLWDGKSMASGKIGSRLGSGDSLHLLEGVAEFTLNWPASGSATLALEGPAAMMLNSEGMPTLRFGRLTATVNTSFRPFVLETPVGRLVLADYGSVGVSAFGNDAEIHVFDGSAMLEPAWLTSPDQQNLPLAIEAGEAIRIKEGENSELSITRHSADEAYFAAQVSMDSDELVVPNAYVEAVKSARPIGYWRFERSAWPTIPNEVADRFACHVNGSLGTTTHQGNQAVDFGVTDQGGEIVSSDVLDDAIGESYSIEFWIKPSHYHVGAVISLVGDLETPTGVIPHGLLLEMGGTGNIPTALHHPGRVRFLHRSPASNDSETGTSCYSTAAYVLRKWQHVVAVKDAAKMRLYVDGELAGEAEDASSLTPNLRLLVGRLYPSRGVRPFIGQLDELALYDRALGESEIQAHCHAIRPPQAGANIY